MVAPLADPTRRSRMLVQALFVAPVPLAELIFFAGLVEPGEVGSEWAALG